MSSISKFNASSSVNKATITWVIDNFANKTNFEYSPVFGFPNNDKIGFKLFLSFNVDIPLYPNTKYVVVYLYLDKCDKNDLPVRYRLSMLDATKQKYNEQVNQVTMATNPSFRGFQQYQVWRDYLLNSANGLLVNGKVTFYCEVEMVEDKVPVYDEANRLKSSQNYEALLENGAYADVIFKFGDLELKAHKLILSTQSLVFAAMFLHDCKENRENVVEITDVSADVFKELLRFIYTGNTPDLEQFPLELLAAADKYQLDCLKSLCSRFLSSKLDVESVAGILQLADLHQATELKSECINYINNKRIVQVMATDGWKRLLTTDCKDLLVELFQDIGIKNQE